MTDIITSSVRNLLTNTDINPFEILADNGRTIWRNLIKDKLDQTQMIQAFLSSPHASTLSNHKDDQKSLILAVKWGHPNNVKVLLDSGLFDPTLVDNNRSTALIHAIYVDDLEIVKMLLDNPYVFKQAVMDNGETLQIARNALLLTAILNRPQIMRLLLGMHKWKASQLNSALIEASIPGRSQLVKMLLQAGANPQTVDPKREGLSALQLVGTTLTETDSEAEASEAKRLLREKSLQNIGKVSRRTKRSIEQPVNWERILGESGTSGVRTNNQNIQKQLEALRLMDICNNPESQNLTALIAGSHALEIPVYHPDGKPKTKQDLCNDLRNQNFPRI
jgi:hypothetical protein